MSRLGHKPIVSTPKHYLLLPSAGQSNSNGTGVDGTTLTSTNLDDQILFGTKSGSWVGASFEYPEDGWPHPVHDTGQELSNFMDYDAGFGPERGYARYIAAQGNNVAVFKAAFNGLGLGQYWQKSLGSNSNLGVYQLCVDLTLKAKSDLEALGHTVEIPAFFFPQYHDDSNESQALADGYEAALNQFIADLRSDLSLPSLPIVLMRAPSWSNAPYISTTRAAVESVSASDANVHYVNTDDLDQVGDNVHFTSEAKEAIGIRMAQSLGY